MAYILVNRVQDKIDGKVRRRTNYYGGLGPVILGHPIQQWNVPKKDAVRFATMAEGKRAMKHLRCIDCEEWCKIQYNWFEKYHYELLKVK